MMTSHMDTRTRMMNPVPWLEQQQPLPSSSSGRKEKKVIVDWSVSPPIQMTGYSTSEEESESPLTREEIQRGHLLPPRQEEEQEQVPQEEEEQVQQQQQEEEPAPRVVSKKSDRKKRKSESKRKKKRKDKEDNSNNNLKEKDDKQKNKEQAKFQKTLEVLPTRTPRLEEERKQERLKRRTSKRINGSICSLPDRLKPVEDPTSHPPPPTRASSSRMFPHTSGRQQRSHPSSSSAAAATSTHNREGNHNDEATYWQQKFRQLSSRHHSLIQHAQHLEHELENVRDLLAQETEVSKALEEECVNLQEDLTLLHQTQEYCLTLEEEEESLRRVLGLLQADNLRLATELQKSQVALQQQQQQGESGGGTAQDPNEGTMQQKLTQQLVLLNLQQQQLRHELSPNPADDFLEDTSLPPHGDDIDDESSSDVNSSSSSVLRSVADSFSGTPEDSVAKNARNALAAARLRLQLSRAQSPSLASMHNSGISTLTPNTLNEDSFSITSRSTFASKKSRTSKKSFASNKEILAQLRKAIQEEQERIPQGAAPRKLSTRRQSFA